MARFEELLEKREHTTVDGREICSWSHLSDEELIEAIEASPEWYIPEDEFNETPYTVLCHRLDIDSRLYETVEELLDAFKRAVIPQEKGINMKKYIATVTAVNEPDAEPFKLYVDGERLVAELSDGSFEEVYDIQHLPNDVEAIDTVYALYGEPCWDIIDCIERIEDGIDEERISAKMPEGFSE